MKHGVIILKPDFFEYGNEIKKLLSQLIIRNGLVLNQIYKIEDYGSFCEEYRAYDIARTEFTNQEAQTELLRTSYATYVYKQLFSDKVAAAMVFDGIEENKLYTGLSDLKKTIREYIKNNKKDEYYVDITDAKWHAFRHFDGDEISQDYLDSDKVKLAYLNGIHLEEEKLFNNDICYTFLVKKGVIPNGKKLNEKERGKVDEDFNI